MVNEKVKTKIYATFITRDGFRREVILPELQMRWRLPREPGNRLWMAKLENDIALPRDPHREFYLESKKVIRNEYGTTIRAIYREE